MKIAEYIDNLIKITEEQDLVDKVVDTGKQIYNSAKHYVTTHLARKPISTAPVKHMVNQATNHISNVKSSLKNSWNDIENATKEKMSAIDAEEAKNKADLATKHAAVRAKLDSQNAMGAMTSQKGFEARIKMGEKGYGATPGVWYRDRKF